VNVTAEHLLEEIRSLPPSELQRVWQAIGLLLAKPEVGKANSPVQPEPGATPSSIPGTGHPGGSLEPGDPFFVILERLEAERHSRRPRQAPTFA